jgi:hypothetical protein
MSLSRRILLVVIVAPMLVWIGWWGFKHAAWWTPAGRDIAHVVRGAASVNASLLTPPQAYKNVPITAAEMSRLSRMAQRKLGDYYTGALLSGWRNTAERTLNAKDLHHGKNSDWITHWRVAWVHLGELTLLPGNADVTASVEYQSNGGAVNRVDDTFHLVDTRQGWRIDLEGSQFENGYGP